MPRYVAVRQQQKPLRSCWHEYDYSSWSTQAQPLGQPSVYDSGPVRTGLLDKDGNDICRVPDQIGFVERKG